MPISETAEPKRGEQANTSKRWTVRLMHGPQTLNGQPVANVINRVTRECSIADPYDANLLASRAFVAGYCAKANEIELDSRVTDNDSIVEPMTEDQSPGLLKYLLHTDDGRHLCPHCGQTLETESDFSAHVRSVHGIESATGLQV